MNTYSVVRSNYFRVKDAEVFREFISRILCDEERLEVWERKAADGATLFAFGTYGSILGLLDEYGEFDDDKSYDNFIAGLQECVAEDDAVIITTVGHEKLRSVFAEAYIVTSDDSEYLDFQDEATDLAASMLEDKIARRC